MPQSKNPLNAGGFSDVDAAGDTSTFVAYLDGAARAVKSFRQIGDDLLQLGDGSRLIDVGCGTGDATASLAVRVSPSGFAVGVDSSEVMVTEARKRSAASGLPLEFKVASAHELPFPDDYFDACTAERLFVHLTEPGRVLAEMVRVLKPGGRLVVREGDLDLVGIDASDKVTTRAVATFFADSVRNGWAGRQLFRLFEAANLADVALHPHPMTLTSFDVLNALLPFEGTVQVMAQNGKLAPEAASAWIADLRERDAAGRFFACILGFIAFGRKP